MLSDFGDLRLKLGPVDLSCSEERLDDDRRKEPVHGLFDAAVRELDEPVDVGYHRGEERRREFEAQFAANSVPIDA